LLERIERKGIVWGEKEGGGNCRERKKRGGSEEERVAGFWLGVAKI